jgi:nickel/cobalt exporter
MAAIALTGLGTGALHALSGPDHVLSLAPYSLARPKHPWRIGLAWGTGHGVGTLLTAVPLLLALHYVALAARWADAAAGLALIGTGMLDAAAPSQRALLSVGLVHGVTGAATLLMLLPSAVSGSLQVTLVYLGAFALGSTLAMALLTALLTRMARHVARYRVVAPILSILLGATWLCGIL